MKRTSTLRAGSPSGIEFGVRFTKRSRRNQSHMTIEIQDTFAYRQQVERGELPDTYQYERMPETVRWQVIHMWEKWEEGASVPIVVDWEDIESTVACELGIECLSQRVKKMVLTAQTRPKRPYLQCKDFLLNDHSVDEHLTLVEYSFRSVVQSVDVVLGRLFSGYQRLDTVNKVLVRNKHKPEFDRFVDNIITTLNERFRRAGFGYRYESGQIIRISSEHIHAEVVRPALHFIETPGFEGPRSEFLKAHQLYREGQYEPAIVEACKAFESTLRSILSLRGTAVTPKASIRKLIGKLAVVGILPPSLIGTDLLQSLNSLASILARIRNQEAAHGAGSTARHSDDHLAALGLHVAASMIQFMVKAHETNPRGLDNPNPSIAVPPPARGRSSES